MTRSARLLRPRQDDPGQVELAGVRASPFYKGGLIGRADVLKSAYAQFSYVASGADHDQLETMRHYMSELVKGWDVETGARRSCPRPSTSIVDPMVYEEAVDLIEEHKEAGRDVIIISSSGTEVVEPIGERLGVDRAIGTQVEIVDGKYTGEIIFYAYGEGKAEAMRALAEENGYDLADCYAYTDCADRPADARDRRAPVLRQPRRRAAQGRGRARLADRRLRPPGRDADHAAAHHQRRTPRTTAAPRCGSAPRPSPSASPGTPPAAAERPPRSADERDAEPPGPTVVRRSPRPRRPRPRHEPRRRRRRRAPARRADRRAARERGRDPVAAPPPDRARRDRRRSWCSRSSPAVSCGCGARCRSPPTRACS